MTSRMPWMERGEPPPNKRRSEWEIGRIGSSSPFMERNGLEQKRHAVIRNLGGSRNEIDFDRRWNHTILLHLYIYMYVCVCICVFVALNI